MAPELKVSLWTIARSFSANEQQLVEIKNRVGQQDLAAKRLELLGQTDEFFRLSRFIQVARLDGVEAVDEFLQTGLVFLAVELIGVGRCEIIDRTFQGGQVLHGFARQSRQTG